MFCKVSKQNNRHNYLNRYCFLCFITMLRHSCKSSEWRNHLICINFMREGTKTKYLFVIAASNRLHLILYSDSLSMLNAFIRWHRIFDTRATYLMQTTFMGTKSIHLCHFRLKRRIQNGWLVMSHTRSVCERHIACIGDCCSIDELCDLMVRQTQMHNHTGEHTLYVKDGRWINISVSYNCIIFLFTSFRSFCSVLKWIFCFGNSVVTKTA